MRGPAFAQTSAVWTLRNRPSFLVDMCKSPVFAIVSKVLIHRPSREQGRALQLTRVLTSADSVTSHTCFAGVFFALYQHHREGFAVLWMISEMISLGEWDFLRESGMLQGGVAGNGRGRPRGFTVQPMAQPRQRSGWCRGREMKGGVEATLTEYFFIICCPTGWVTVISTRTRLNLVIKEVT